MLPGSVVVDTDQEIVRRARTDNLLPRDPSGEDPEPPIRRVYQHLGPARFAGLEADVVNLIRQTVAQRVGPPGEQWYIVSTGGGICDNTEALEHLRRLRPIVYLRNDPRILYGRFIQRGVPAFLDPLDPMGSFMKLVERRHRAYHELADHEIDISEYTIGQSARYILDLVR